MNLGEDYHVHSTFSDDGSSTLAENVSAAAGRGLRTLCLADHVRRDTAWVPEFAAAVSEYRGRPGLRVLAGVEAKIWDGSGRLDLPDALDGIDLVLIADHQFPADNGPVHPAEVRSALAYGGMTAAEAIERICEATARAVLCGGQWPGGQWSGGERPGGPGVLLAHLFSLLPKIGLDETMIPDALLADLAKRAAHAGALAEVNEKWSCPSPRTVTALVRAGVTVVAGSDSHHCQDIGRYDRWVRPTLSAVGA